MDKKLILKRIGIGIAVAAVLYTLTGFFIVPITAKWFINSRLGEKIGRPVHVSNVHFNPWTLAGGIEGLTIASLSDTSGDEENGKPDPLFSVASLRVNLAASSIFTFCPTITQVEVDSPHFRLERHRDNSFNITDIIQRFSDGTPKASADAESKEGIPLRVSNVKLSNGRILFKDRVADLEHRIDAISLDVPILSSIPKERSIPIEAMLGFTFNGGNISLQLNGQPFAHKRSANVELNISSLALGNYFPYLPIPAGLIISSPGQLETRLAMDYEERESGLPRIAISGTVNLHDVSAGMLPQGGEEVQPLISIPGLLVEPAVEDLLSEGIKIGNISVDNAEFHLERTTNGALLPLTVLAASNKTTETSGKDITRKGISPIPVDIARAEIKNATLNFLDNAVTPAFGATVKHTGLVVRDLRANEKLTFSYALSAVSEAIENFNLEGNASVAVSQSGPDISLEGKIGVGGILPERLKAYYTPFIGDAIGVGRLDVGSDYRFVLNEGTPAGGLHGGKLNISDIRLSDQTNDTPAVQLGSLGISDIGFSLDEKQLLIGSVTTDQGRIQALRDNAGKINILQTILSLPVLNRKDEDSKPSSAAPQTSPAWDIKLGQITVDDYTIGFTDEMHTEPINMKVSDIRLRANPFGTENNPKGSFSADMTLKTGGKLVVDGTMDIPDSKADMRILFNKVNLKAVQPYFTDHLNISIEDGHLQSKGNLLLDWRDKKKPTVTFLGEAGINDFISKNKATGNDFFKFKSFYLGGMDVSVFPLKVRISEVSLSDFYNRAVLSKEGRLNISDIIIKKDPTHTNKRASETEKAPLPEVAIDTLTIQGGHVNFTDYLTTPNYTANMTDIAGSVTGLSSRGDKPASVRLKGLHGTHSPLDISGTIDPLKQTPAVDLGVSFKNIELPQFNAYAKKYLGYEIEKGKLILELQYKINGTSLDSSNRIFFDQFTLGQRVESEDATSLPVELAISLLKNSRGEIDLDVPVSGDLSDPEFSYGGVIFKTVSNLMFSIVKAPFKILGNLMGFGGEELGAVAFSPGSHHLDDGAKENLEQLTALLVDKPQISLEILGRFDPIQDDTQLRQQRFKEMLASHLSGSGSPDNINLDIITPEQRDAAVAAAYTAAAFPKPKDAAGNEMAITTDEKEKLLITALSIPEADLEALARQRCDTVRDYLVVTGKVDPGRIFIHKPAPTEETDTENQRVKTLFKLK